MAERLWTIRHAAELAKLERTGVLRADPRRASRGFEVAYRWMASQLAAVAAPPRPDSLPLWAWYRWHGKARARPDLRASGHLPAGQPGVRIAFDIDPGACLLSDFDAWHAVLNRHYLATSERDADAFDRRLDRAGSPTPAALSAEIERSWRRIFDLDRVRGWGEDPDSLAVQAVFWELRRDQVCEVDHFIAR